MKNTTLLLSLLLQITIFSHVFAQNGRILNIEEAVMGQVGTFAPATLTALQWRPQTAFYTYASGDSLIQTDARSGKTSLLLTLKQVNDALAKEKLSKIPSIAYVAWKSTDHLTIYAREGKVFFDVIHKKIDRIHRNIEGAAHVEESSVEELLAYTVENNLYIRKPDGETIQLTHDAPMSGIVNGQVVHRNEFGITKGIFWSPQADSR